MAEQPQDIGSNMESWKVWNPTFKRRLPAFLDLTTCEFAPFFLFALVPLASLPLESLFGSTS